MDRLSLTEYRCHRGAALRPEQVHALSVGVPSLAIAPSLSLPGCFDLTPGSTIGVAAVGDLEIEIRPKIPIERVLFLVSYSVDPHGWRDMLVPLPEAATLVEAVVPMLVRLVARATHRGLLHGYRTEEASLATVRGQLRVADHVRERFGLAPPLEVRFDDFTPDIEENRLLLAALERLLRLRVRSASSARALREVLAAFDGVQRVEYDPRRLPEPPITRLNQHYDAAMRLARLVLRAASLELGAGGTSGTAFLLDMNDVFEAFVHRALQEALGLTDRQFPRCLGGLRLDQAGKVRLEPDLSWWRGGRCVFVGDAKYKRLSVQGFQHGDLYQLLAYCTAADLPGGLLVYAAGEAKDEEHTVVHAGKTLRVRVLDVTGTPTEVLARVEQVAAEVESLAGQDAAA